ncbi:transcription antitermination factor NusB [Candidatus Giovannonibacteria bacterium RIFCSPLOWO2_01_FULL_46_13]|uniref:Transcription antitermination protein NusB n=1 Tax=Candidatus Giovannonibacteria bacterium RIFCSPLOWO2_01_FULL_46_13 TaxID=1798352 RepID=A0A1F5X5T7_9BACT|nr:MAG: transcription antitermination factor NusB [Candidatus Giovannonibacteria bacterium RIFCSPHIGHO2_12_FULL_44_22]OGF82931.1 MAG: transcription antitermination factor NusB [Candidatus Giovannonibacteria bacterium RIFCSPLOWO2_01_FULL_46_13]
MQSLFQWDFNGRKDEEIEKVLEANLKEFAPGLDDRQFVKELVEGVLKNRDRIDSIIEKAAPEWPLEQVAMVDRNVLRIGLYELLFGSRKEVPPKVAINEAIELAKTFGSESSGRFVNGVLGTVYREIGEPGRDETSKKKATLEDLENLPVEAKAGGIVYRKEGKNLQFALVHDVFGYWTLSKGSPLENEEATGAAERKVKEELGIKSAKVIEKLGQNEYIAKDPEKGQVRRKVDYFLLETEDRDLNLEPSGGLDDAKWFKVDELKDIKTYPDIKPLFSKALEIINKQS